MKKQTLFMLAFLCLHLLGRAQPAGAGGDLETQVAQATSQLDLSECTTGIFTDRLPQYVPLEYFDGSYLSDSTTLTAGTFNLMYGLLDKGHIGASSMPPVDAVWLQHNEQAERDTIELAGLYYTYHQFKPTAMDEGLIVWDGSYFQDVSGANASPYRQIYILENLLFNIVNNCKSVGYAYFIHIV